MKSLVVYESMFGNTERVARAVASGLAEHGDVELLDVRAAPRALDSDVDLVVVGGPTHAFAMSRPQTRSDAVRQGAFRGDVRMGLREWLLALEQGASTQLVATFDTRASKVRHLPGSAARSAARVLRKHGFGLVARSEGFYVRDVAGPLLDGETERATEWGRDVATAFERRGGEPEALGRSGD